VIGLWGIVSSLQALSLAGGEASIKELFWKRVQAYPPDKREAIMASPLVHDMLNAVGEVAASERFALANRINAAMCAVVVLLGIGIWLLRDLARKAAVGFFLLSVPVYSWVGHICFSTITNAFVKNNLQQLFYAFGDVTMYLFLTVANMIILIVNAAVIIFYFTHPNVREQFRG
jgi:hypothetical protein